MTLEEIEQKIGQVLSRERKEMSIRYRTKHGSPQTIYTIAPIHWDYLRDLRPRRVREDLDEVELNSDHYELLVTLNDQIQADHRAVLGERLAQRFQDAQAFHRKQGEILKAGTAAMSSSELPLIAEFLVRNGSKQSFLRAIRGAALSPGLTLLLRQVEDMIAFNFILFDDREYATLSSLVGELEGRVAQFAQQRAGGSTIERNTAFHLKEELPMAISTLKDVIEQARVTLIKHAVRPKPVLRVSKEVVQGLKQLHEMTIGFNSVRDLLHKDLQGFGHYFDEGKTKEAMNAAFTRVENRLNEIRDSSSDQSVKLISGTSLVHKLFATGLMDLPYQSLARGNQKSREAYVENLRLFLASGVGWFRNSFSHEPHNLPDISCWEALELLMVASHMLRTIDRCLVAGAPT